jgi:hypothetical protein
LQRSIGAKVKVESNLRTELSELLDRGKIRAPDEAPALARDKAVRPIQPVRELKKPALEDSSIVELRARFTVAKPLLDISTWDKARIIQEIDSLNLQSWRKRPLQNWSVRYLKQELLGRDEQSKSTLEDKDALIAALKLSYWRAEFT